MNSKRVYRICKKSHFNTKYGIGPYGYIIRKLYQFDGYIDEDISLLKNTLESKERWVNMNFHENVFDKIRKHKVFIENGVFSSYKVHRPGIYDDPVLKDNLRKKGFSREKFNEFIILNNLKFFSAFDSEKQLYDWFNDPIELSILDKYGFKIQSFKEDTKNIFFGLKQVLIINK